MKVMVILVEIVFKVLLDILIGKVFVIDILFLDLFMDLVEGVYKNN